MPDETKSITLPEPRSPADVFKDPPSFSGDDDYRRSRDLSVSLVERERIIAWLREPERGPIAYQLAARIAKGEHLK